MSAIIKKHFWKWFEQSHKQYMHLYKKPKKEANYLDDELTAHLKAYCKRLNYDLFWHIDQPLCEMIITANSDPRFFRKAEALVKVAPTIPGWKFMALHQPKPIDFMVSQVFPDLPVDPHRLWFKPDSKNRQGKLLHIKVYSELFREELKQPYSEALYMMLFNLLGEKSMALNIGSVEIDNLSNAGSKDDILRMEELPSYVQSMQLLLEIDSKGILQERRTL